MDTTPTLFDLTQFEQAPTAPAARSRKSRSESRSPKRSGISAEIAREFQLAKVFRMGQLVRRRSAERDRIGMVAEKYLRRDRSSGIWVIWQKEPHAFSPFERFPISYLPSDLEIIEAAPSPKLPRDVERVDSLVDESPKPPTRESDQIDSLVDESPKPPTRESKVEEYYPRGQARGNRAYYRLYWWDAIALKNRYRHIRGGNIHAAPARERAAKIREAIARGLPLNQILEMC